MSIKRPHNHSASTRAMSKAVSFAFMVDLIKMICLLQDLHDIAPPPKVNTYPLVEYIPIDFPNEIRNEDQHHLMIDQLAYKIPLVHYTDQLTINIIYLLQMQLYPHAIKFTALLCFMMLGNWVKIFHPRNFGVTETLENS
jgi:hypothetical protein